MGLRHDGQPRVWAARAVGMIHLADPRLRLGVLSYGGRVIRYLSRAEFAERIGVQPDTLGRYKLPEPDAIVGSVRGWLPETVDAWHASRPVRGARG